MSQKEQTLVLIRAKFASQCAETGMYIPKGVNVYWNPAAKKVYSQESNTASKYRDSLSMGQRDAAGDMHTAGLEQAQDNWAATNL